MMEASHTSATEHPPVGISTRLVNRGHGNLVPAPLGLDQDDATVETAATDMKLVRGCRTIRADL